MLSRENRKILKYVFISFLLWRLTLLFITFFGISTLPIHFPLDGSNIPVNQSIQYWARWANWDGGHFTGIAAHGYLPMQAVFLPFYPLLIKTVSLLHISIFWSGFLLANLFCISALFFLYKLALFEFNEKVAKTAVFLLLIFPTSFYLGAVYSESLFLTLVLASFYFFRRKKLLLASILAGLSSVTRIAGLALIAVFFIDYLLKSDFTFDIKNLFHSFPRKIVRNTVIVEFILDIVINVVSPSQTILLYILTTIAQIVFYMFLLFLCISILAFIVKWFDFEKIQTKNFLILFISFLPLTVYGVFEYMYFGSPLSLISSEKNWNRNFTFPWEAPISYVQALTRSGLFNLLNGELILELCFFLVFLLGFFFTLKKLKPVYSIYYFFALLIPLFSGTLISIHRYYLAIFPFFFLIAQVKNEELRQAVIILSAMLLGILSVMYINSYWVT